MMPAACYIYIRPRSNLCTHTLHPHVGGGNTRATLAPARLARSLRLTDVAWAVPAAAAAAGCSNPAEQALRLSLLEPLVTFLVGELALPLLRAAFFVTEADGTGACAFVWR